MVTAVQRGQSNIYGNGYVMQGRGPKFDKFKSNVKAANDFAKKHKVVTKASGVASALGFDDYLNRKTDGVYSKGIDFAKSKGYGKRRKLKY